MKKNYKNKESTKHCNCKAANFNFIFRDEAAAKSLLADMKRPELLLLIILY